MTDRKEQFKKGSGEKILKKSFQIDDDKPFKWLSGDVCLVKRVPVEQVETHFKSLITPDTIHKSKNYGLVVQVGKECEAHPEQFAQPGDVVMMYPECGHTLEIGKNEYIVIRHKDFFGAIDTSNEVEV